MAKENNNTRKNIEKEINRSKRFLLFVVASLILTEIILVVLSISLLVPNVFAGIGHNVTVSTTLDIGNVYPEIESVVVGGGITSLDLTANATTILSIVI